MKPLHYLLTAVSLLTGWNMSAEITLPDIVGTNMVLQQQADARLWGWATPGSKVTVAGGWNPKQKVTATAGANGRWDVFLPTPAATFEPQTIKIKGDGSDITLENVLVGEVWFCSGQSNMEMPLRGFNMQPVDEAAEAIAYAGKYPGIRVATVPLKVSYTPMETVESPWLESTPENAPGFSAMAYFFARALTDLIDTPVGIISCAYGGSKVEGWQSREQLEKYPECDIEKEKNDPEIHNMHRINCMYNAMLHPLIGYTIKGFLWNQGESNVGMHDSYPTHLLDMVTEWRQQWGEGELPFYFVEIPGWQYNDPNDTGAAIFRECQHRAAEMIPNSGIIGTADMVYPDQAYCIHSPIKRPQGERLAFLAGAKTYGIKGLPVDYPHFNSMTTDGSRASIKLDNVPYGFLPINGIQGFEAAGEDGIFYPANAWADWGQLTLEINCPDVPVVKNVRYCYKNFDVGTVRNHLGLPLIPFSTHNE